MNYLSTNELAELVGCQPTSYACMRRWLTKNGWPFEVNRIGVPRVSRAYHDERMSGSKRDTIINQSPNFDWMVTA